MTTRNVVIAILFGATAALAGPPNWKWLDRKIAVDEEHTILQRDGVMVRWSALGKGRVDTYNDFADCNNWSLDHNPAGVGTNADMILRYVCPIWERRDAEHKTEIQQEQLKEELARAAALEAQRRYRCNTATLTVVEENECSKEFWNGAHRRWGIIK